MGGVAVIMQIFGCVMSEYFPVSGGWSYVVGHFYYARNGCFPLFQWFIFPVAGIIFGSCLRHITDKDTFYRSVPGISTVLLIGFCSALYFAKYNIQNFYILKDDIFYRQEFFHSIFAILVILIELALLYFITKGIKATAFHSLIEYISVKLNPVYINQWMLVGTTTFVFMMADMEDLNAVPAILLGFAFVVLSVLICKLYDKLKSIIE